MGFTVNLHAQVIRNTATGLLFILLTELFDRINQRQAHNRAGIKIIQMPVQVRNDIENACNYFAWANEIIVYNIFRNPGK